VVTKGLFSSSSFETDTYKIAHLKNLVILKLEGMAILVSKQV